MLSKPVVSQPGTLFNYNSGCSVLFGGITEHAIEISVETFAEQALFSPLGIVDVWWDKLTLTDNLARTHGMLHMRTRDMAKFG